ncbi:MAG TPA: phosphoribosylamine--glycine ligase [Candidatus Acidoferrales bacterium]|jgi:phosphoribosylamine--glycine ligase|nr:phosphoribosylamine--glycine ligase [Candidatus Acidoferrales bacterium]
MGTRCVYLSDGVRILVIGGGGREHALVWKLRQSPQVEKVWCAPGNGGIAQDAECLSADTREIREIVALASRLRPDLTVVGPELPLVLGIGDEFARLGLRMVGPSKEAAELEGSKVFAKGFLERHGIPTPSVYGVYDSPGDAYGALCAVDWPVAIKADGLCGGKGVLVTASPDEATAFIERLMEKREFGESGTRVLMEEALEGQELSFIVLTDGEGILLLAPTRDHKRVFDGNQGPNTGGMGAYSSDDLLSPGLEKTILERIVRPTIRGMAADGRPYKGFLYIGLMLTVDGPKVLEFNCRMGDPEAQPIVVRMDFDLAEALGAVTRGTVGSIKPAWKAGASACVVMASRGYPGTYNVGMRIEGLDEARRVQGVVVFHAGTSVDGGSYYTSGGRALGVTATGQDPETAIRSCYEAVSKIRFDGAHYRTDIGVQGLRKTPVARG